MKFGVAYADRFKRKASGRRDVWHLDEVVISINGEKRWLWRTVDQDGYVLDEIVQARRDTKAAKRLLIRLLKKQGYTPKRMITDKLGSYAAAKRLVTPKVEHRSHKGLNNRAENGTFFAKARTHDARVSIVVEFTAFRLDLFRRSQPLRSTSFSSLRLRHPPASPERDRGMEICGSYHCLKLFLAMSG